MNHLASLRRDGRGVEAVALPVSFRWWVEPLQTELQESFTAAVARRLDPAASAAAPLTPEQRVLASRMAGKLSFSALREKRMEIRPLPTTAAEQSPADHHHQP